MTRSRRAGGAGGQVVDLEQLGQFVRVLATSLHPVQQVQLTVHQALAPSGDVEEDLVEPATQGDLVHRGLDGGALHLGEGAPDLADLVVAVLQRRRLPGDVDLLATAQPGHHVGQPVLGQLQRGGADAAEPPDQGPADPQRHQHRDDHGDESEHAGGGQPHQDADRHRHRTVGEGVGLGQLEVPQLLLHRVLAGLPGRRVDRGAAGPVGYDQRVLHRAQPGERLTLGQPLVRGPAALGQVGQGALGEPPLVADGLYELGVFPLGEPPCGQRAGQQRVALAEQFPGASQRGERQCLPVDVRVGQGRHAGERLEGRGDHAAVQADRAGPVHFAVVDELPPAG